MNILQCFQTELKALSLTFSVHTRNEVNQKRACIRLLEVCRKCLWCGFSLPHTQPWCETPFRKPDASTFPSADASKSPACLWLPVNEYIVSESSYTTPPVHKSLCKCVSKQLSGSSERKNALSICDVGCAQVWFLHVTQSQTKHGQTDKRKEKVNPSPLHLHSPPVDPFPHRVILYSLYFRDSRRLQFPNQFVFTLIDTLIVWCYIQPLLFGLFTVSSKHITCWSTGIKDNVRGHWSKGPRLELLNYYLLSAT